MELEEAKKVLNVFYGRCKNCANEEYCDGCYIDAEDVEAISTVLQELEHLQKENEMQKFEIHLATERIGGELEVLENYSFNKWENHFGFEKETVAVKRIRNITNGLKDLLKEE